VQKVLDILNRLGASACRPQVWYVDTFLLHMSYTMLINTA